MNTSIKHCEFGDIKNSELSNNWTQNSFRKYIIMLWDLWGTEAHGLWVQIIRKAAAWAHNSLPEKPDRFGVGIYRDLVVTSLKSSNYWYVQSRPIYLDYMMPKIHWAIFSAVGRTHLIPMSTPLIHARLSVRSPVLLQHRTFSFDHSPVPATNILAICVAWQLLNLQTASSYYLLLIMAVLDKALSTPPIHRNDHRPQTLRLPCRLRSNSRQ